MKVLNKYDFTYIPSEETDDTEKTQWKCIEIETSIGELTSVFNKDSTIIDYDGRGPGNHWNFTEHLDELLEERVEEHIIDAIGGDKLISLRAKDEYEDDSAYQETLKTAKRMAKRDKLHIVLMTRDGMDTFFDKNRPYAKMVVPYEFGYSEKLKDYIKYNWDKQIENDRKGFVPFDTFMENIEPHIDTAYLRSIFPKNV